MTDHADLGLSRHQRPGPELPRPARAHSEQYPALSGLLAHLPDEASGDGWTPQRRQAFMQTFEQVLDFCIPIKEVRTCKRPIQAPRVEKALPRSASSTRPAAKPSAEPDDLVKKFIAWVNVNGVSIEEAAKKSRLTWQTCKNLLDGTSKKPRVATLEKIRALLISVESPAATVGNGAGPPHLPRVPTANEAAAYLQRTVSRWMKDRAISHDEASQRLSIRKRVLLDVLELKLPGDRALEILCRRIPELANDYDSIRQGRLQQEKQNAKTVA